MEDKVVVVGAGPVGALAALYAAKRGHNVEVYEFRGDLRDPQTVPLNFTKSINLAISERGLNSIKQSGQDQLLSGLLEDTIPMHGRMIHGRKHDRLYEESQAYDAFGRYIRAVDRGRLNGRLLDHLDKLPNVKLFFNHKLIGADFKTKKAWFARHSVQPGKRDSVQTGRTAPHERDELEVCFDLMLGADGAHSATRHYLMKHVRMDFSQHYIETQWCEFNMLPSSSGDFRLSPNHLHIWPAGDSMFIAIPSLDKSFTCTLFADASQFDQLDLAPQNLIAFFDAKFPGVVGPLISKDNVQNQYMNNPHLPLISIKCTPHHFDSSVVILGDAAHAMVPFYGQGMNAGLEDVRVLFDMLDAHPRTPDGRRDALARYSSVRTPDVHASNDLALRNYQEMRADVQSPVYLLRKMVEETLSKHVPWLGFATQYSRVSFSNMRYSDAERLAAQQGLVLSVAGITTLLVPVLGFGIWAWLRWHE